MHRRHFLRALALGSGALGLGTLRVGLARADAPQPGTQAVVATDALNLRGGPARDEPLLGSLPAGTAVDLLGASADGAWWRIAAGDAVGYVDGEYLLPTGAPAASPAFDLDLPIAYARQLTPIWCDPADLEMWLAYHAGAAPGPSYARQQALWAWETSHNAGFSVDQWDCSPYAVASAAHEWMPDAGFDHVHYDDPLDATRLLAWLLAHPAYREPSVVLIWAGAHYVLVRGVRALGDPSQDPTGAHVLGFYVADPNKGDPSWLGQDRFIPLDRWLGEMLTPVTSLTPHTGVPGDIWQGQCVTIQRTWTAAGPTAAGQHNPSAAQYA